MNAATRALARGKGLKLASKIATMGGVAVAVLGLVEAGAARASVPAPQRHAIADDTKPLPMETWAKAAQGGCGCAPCWGPPAPPARTARRSMISARVRGAR